MDNNEQRLPHLKSEYVANNSFGIPFGYHQSPPLQQMPKEDLPKEKVKKKT